MGNSPRIDMRLDSFVLTHSSAGAFNHALCTVLEKMHDASCHPATMAWETALQETDVSALLRKVEQHIARYITGLRQS
jgi:hypothetical protein